VTGKELEVERLNKESEVEKLKKEVMKYKQAADFYKAVNDNLREQIKKYKKYKAKAKDLIHNIIRVTWKEGWSYSLGWKVKAEQFLEADK